MNRYQSYETSNRALLGMAAIALTAITIGLSLFVPAQMASGVRQLPGSALSTSLSPATADVGGPLRVDVTAVREPSLASVQAHAMQAKHKQRS